MIKNIWAEVVIKLCPYWAAFRYISTVHIRINLELLILQTVGRALWTEDGPSRKAATYTGQHKHRKTSMPRVGFEPMIPVFERAKTFHASECTATQIHFHSNVSLSFIGLNNNIAVA
jgi:hypothetical protein